MKQLILSPKSNQTIEARFVYGLSDDYKHNLIAQFSEQQRQHLFSLFDDSVYLRFDREDVRNDPYRVTLYATISGITVDKIKAMLEKEFPVIVCV